MLYKTFFLFLMMAFSLSAQLGKTFDVNQGVSSKIPDEIKDIKVIEHLGETLPLDLEFTDDTGKKVKLGDYFKGDKPVVINLIYFYCPRACSAIVNGVCDSLKKISEGERPLVAGKDYRLLTISFSKHAELLETPELAAQKKKAYLASYGMEHAKDDWGFLIGSPENVTKLTEAMGFGYKWSDSKGEYIHPTVTYIATPTGKLSRYHYNMFIGEFDLKMSLLEAGKGKIGSTVDKILSFCFSYDPIEKKYVRNAQKLMTASGAVTLAILVAFFGYYWMGEFKKKKD